MIRKFGSAKGIAQQVKGIDVGIAETTLSAGNNLACISASSYTTNNVSMTNLVQFTIGYSGSVRTSFQLASSNNSITVYGQIYVNGAARGALRSITSTSPTEYVEDISVNAGDLVQIYSRTTNVTYNSLIQNPKIMINEAPQALLS